jgi:proteasome lid subunit RPN8/RPN11
LLKEDEISRYRIKRQVVDDIVAHARQARPAECCGMLIGRGDVVLESVPATNLARDPNRFLIDPKDHIAARRTARAAGYQIVGFYHSHPHSPPEPSPTDLAEASYDGALYLIVGLAEEPPPVRMYCLRGTRFESISIDIVSDL